MLLLLLNSYFGSFDISRRFLYISLIVQIWYILRCIKITFMFIFIIGYGLTETSPVVHLDSVPGTAGSIGHLISNTEGKVCMKSNLY